VTGVQTCALPIYPDVRNALSEEEIREKFDLGYHLKHVDTIFARVFGEK
jgi:adenylosuccinate lyase